MLAIITGFPGSGKSTVGPLLAEHLGWKFYDMDETLPDTFKEINREGKHVPQELVDVYFEKTFLKDLKKLDTKNAIISCTLVRPEYVETLRTEFPNAVFLYLKASIETLVERLLARRDHFFNQDLMLGIYGSSFDVRIPENNVSAEQSLENVVADSLAIIEGHIAKSK